MTAHNRSPLKIVGQRVRSRRSELNLSQEELGDKARLHRTYIGSLERGERNPTVLVLLKIAAALKTDVGDFVKGVRP